MTYIASCNVAVVEIPKTATRSLRAAIENNLEVNDAGYVPHLTLQQYLEIYPDLRMGLTLVRDPTERFVSIINFMLKEKVKHVCPPALKKKILSETFDEFLNVLHNKKFNRNFLWFYPQYSFLLAKAPLEIFTLESSNKLLSAIGIQSDLPVMNVSKKKFSESEIFEILPLDLVKKVYSIDFALWDMVNSSSEKVLRVEDAREFILSLGEKYEN